VLNSALLYFICHLKKAAEYYPAAALFSLQ